MKIAGNYSFRKMEMVAGFHFSENGVFQFFYSYGAVDRNATGTFSMDGNKLKLKSDKAPGKDFMITGQSKHAEGYTIKFNHPNKYLLENILCMFFIGDKQEELITDVNGEVHSAFSQCDRIYVQHMLYPDIATLIKDTDNENNYFIVSLNPTLEQVSFMGIPFTIEDENTISCMPNYFMPFENLKFCKD